MISPLQIKNVSKIFLPEKKVLDNISLSLNAGEIYALVGLNGIGKTTLIKIILQLYTQYEGEVRFFGNLASNPESRKNIAYLPEKFQAPLLLSGLEFLNLALSWYDKKLDIKLAKEQAELFGLNPDILNQRIGKYSKGMAQKLGLLSIFLIDAPLFILDEPTSGLDVEARLALKNMLVNFKNKGTSIFFTTHILSDVEEICDRMAVIHNAKIVFADKPKNLLSQQNTASLEQAFLKLIYG